MCVRVPVYDSGGDGSGSNRELYSPMMRVEAVVNYTIETKEVKILKKKFDESAKQSVLLLPHT